MYSPTTKLCVDVLIKPLFLCLLFIIAEREGHWPPHLEADKNKIPIFSAADHVNYARWGLYYISSMETLPDNIHSHFMKGEHTIQFSDTPQSGIGSDMGTEVSYNRIVKRVAGSIGQSTNMETVEIYNQSLNSCCEVVEYLKAMEDKSSTKNMLIVEKKIQNFA